MRRIRGKRCIRKKFADERAAMQQIKIDAILNKFDVLLVLTLDRLGRRDDGTPFVVGWLIKTGIGFLKP